MQLDWNELNWDALALELVRDSQLRDLLALLAKDAELAAAPDLMDTLSLTFEPVVLNRLREIWAVGARIVDFLSHRLDQLADMLRWDDPSCNELFELYAQQAMASTLSAVWFFAEGPGVRFWLVADSLSPGLSDRIARNVAGLVRPEDLRADLVGGYREMFTAWWNELQPV